MTKPIGSSARHAPAQVLPRTTTQVLIEGEAALLERIRWAYGATVANFQKEVMPVVQGYAAYVHLLPAVFARRRPELASLLRIGLQASLYCLQGAEARIFTGHATISERRDAEPRWRMAALVAGLCCELHTTTCWTVTRDDDAVWPRFRESLASWLQARAGAVHHLTLSAAGPGPALNAVLLHQVVPPGVLEDLGAGDGEVLAMLVAGITGLTRPGPPNPLAELVRSALGLVAANVAQPMDADDPGLSRMHPMARFGVQGLRELAAQRVNWQVNAPRSRVWWGSDGVYLQWPDAAEDLTRMLVDAQVAGVPAVPAQWLHLLCACGMVVGPPHAAVMLVQPPAPAQQTQAVRIAHPHWLLDDQLHLTSPLQAALARQPHMLHDAPDLHGVPSTEAPDVNPAGAALPDSDMHTAHPPAPSVSVPSMPEMKDVAALTPATPASPPEPEHSRSPWRLRAPLRLAPPVREVLQAVLHDVQHGLTAGAWRLTDGLFVSADEWTTRGIPAHSAARALQACGMVPREAVGGSALTMRRTADGEQVGTLIGHAYLAMDPSTADRGSELPHADPPV